MNNEFLITQNLFKQITENKYIYKSDMVDEKHLQKLINEIQNFNHTVKEIAQKLGLTFVPENDNGNLCFVTNNDELQDAFKLVFTSIDLLDYITTVLHAPTYREQYKEFKQLDFIRIPYPEDADAFWQFVRLGKEIRYQKK